MTPLSKGLVGISLLVLIIVVFMLKRKSPETPRQMEIKKALGEILKIKMRHHDLIVKALEDGASEQDHTVLLAAKEKEVLDAIDVKEKELGIVIDKENPTEQGPLKLISS